VESSGRELMMDGKAGKAVRSKIHNPEAHGVSSAVWVQQSGFGRGQDTKAKGPAMAGGSCNLSWVSSPDVR
jgi:hypothetical protein